MWQNHISKCIEKFFYSKIIHPKYTIAYISFPRFISSSFKAIPNLFILTPEVWKSEEQVTIALEGFYENIKKSQQGGLRAE